jgi:hypothetical protein
VAESVIPNKYRQHGTIYKNKIYITNSRKYVKLRKFCSLFFPEKLGKDGYSSISEANASVQFAEH